MKDKRRMVMSCILLGIAVFMAGCVVAPPAEGYYDRHHHRWYHQHAWVQCRSQDEHCR